MKTSLPAQLERQLKFMESSAREYDAGNREESIRIGTCLRVLFHQTKRSTSLLKHMSADSIKICSTSAGTPVTPDFGLNVANNLITNPFTGEMRAAPWLDSAPNKNLIPASMWWSGEVVFFNAGIRVTRKDLALWVANQDGGAHVDELQDIDYEKVIRGMDFSFTISWDDGRQIISRPAELHLAALRQFAYEVLASPDLLSLAGRR